MSVKCLSAESFLSEWHITSQLDDALRELLFFQINDSYTFECSITSNPIPEMVIWCQSYKKLFIAGDEAK